MPASENIHLGLVEHVAHVQAAGHVWRRQQHRELLRCLRRISRRRGGFALRRGDVEQALADPVLGPAFFYDRGIVCFWEFVAHRCFKGSIRWVLCSSIAAGDAGQATLFPRGYLCADCSSPTLSCSSLRLPLPSPGQIRTELLLAMTSPLAKAKPPAILRARSARCAFMEAAKAMQLCYSARWRSTVT